MALNIKNAEVERLAAEVAEMTKETKTQAIRHALEERKFRLRRDGTPEERARRIQRTLEAMWATLPPGVRGKGIPQEEQDEILGYGPNGVCEP
jgi:antitoxin VapB